MDKDGKVIFEPKYDVILDTAYNDDSMIRIGVNHYRAYERETTSPTIYKSHIVGLANCKGEFIIPMEYETIILPFRSSLFTLREKIHGNYGVVDINNNTVVEFGLYSWIDGFSNGYSRVKREGKWGIINELGEEVLPCKYKHIKDFYGYDRVWEVK